jgi:hypothetical protein
LVLQGNNPPAANQWWNVKPVGILVFNPMPIHLACMHGPRSAKVFFLSQNEENRFAGGGGLKEMVKTLKIRKILQGFYTVRTLFKSQDRVIPLCVS